MPGLARPSWKRFPTIDAMIGTRQIAVIAFRQFLGQMSTWGWISSLLSLCLKCLGLLLLHGLPHFAAHDGTAHHPRSVSFCSLSRKPSRHPAHTATFLRIDSSVWRCSNSLPTTWRWRDAAEARYSRHVSPSDRRE